MMKVDTSTIVSRKRKHQGEGWKIKQNTFEPSQNFKRPRILPQAATQKRPAKEVLRDVLRTLIAGDRPMATGHMRDFTAEHMSILEGSELPPICDLLIKIALTPKYDDLCRNALRTLLALLARAEDKLWVDVLKKLISEEPKVINLCTRQTLDSSILNLLEAGLKLNHLSSSSLPSRALHMMARSIRASEDAHRRVAALRFNVSRVLQDKNPDSKVVHELEIQLCAMSSDRDARVRNAAVSGLLRMMTTATDFLSTSSYDVVKKLCEDSGRDVRMECLRIVQLFAARNPNEIVIGTNKTKLLLADDAFSVVCHAINDIDVLVRAEAARLLGEFTFVSDSFLDQTLDKKLMKTMKTDKGDAVIRSKQSMFAMTKQPVSGRKWRRNWRQEGHGHSTNSGSEWSTGKKLNEIAPGEVKEMDEDEGESIIPHGACGALVTALEDEFMAVRKAAVYSLGRLAADRPSFATTALDHLADMFNDEIAEVRLDSIYALTPLVVHGQLQKEQLDTILKCLDDAMPQTRQALRILLVQGDFAEVECVRVCVKALLLCMKRFPQDRQNVYKCMSELGSRHAVMVHAVVNELLCLQPIFEPQEFHINDSEYIAKVLMILSAASEHAPILSLLPAFVLRHYRYLRASAPNLVPVIKSVDGDARAEAERRISELRAEWSGERSEILQATYSRLVSVERETEGNRNTLRALIIEDVEAISAFNSALAGGARLVSALSNTCTAMDGAVQSTLFGTDMKTTIQQLEKELCEVLAVQSQFTGIDPDIISFLVECAMHLMFLKTLVEMISHPENLMQHLEQIMKIIEQIKRRYADFGLVMSDGAARLIANIIEMAEESDSKDRKPLCSGSFSDYLLRGLPQLPKQLRGGKEVKVKWAEISEPAKERSLEQPIRFIAGLPTAVPFNADIHNIDDDDVEKLRIQIDYPDQTRAFFRPRQDHLSEEENKIRKLRTEVLLTSLVGWADMAQVSLTVVLLSDASIDSVFPISSVPLFECPAKGHPATIRIMLFPMKGRC